MKNRNYIRNAGYHGEESTMIRIPRKEFYALAAAAAKVDIIRNMAETNDYLSVKDILSVIGGSK